MEEIVRVKLQSLDSEAFRPYGQVLGLKSPVFPEVDEGSPVMIMARLKRAANNTRLDQLAVHFSYNQTFIPLKGSMALVVAPPPRNRDAGADNFELDYDKLAAFVLEPGDAVNIDRGTWHTVVPLGAECLMLSGTRKGAEQQPAVKAGVIEGGRIPVASDPAAKNASPYIEYVDLGKRNRAIVLELQRRTRYLKARRAVKRYGATFQLIPGDTCEFIQDQLSLFHDQVVPLRAIEGRRWRLRLVRGRGLHSPVEDREFIWLPQWMLWDTI